MAEPSPAADEEAGREEDAAAYLDHARKFWDAEETNADRINRQSRLLITLAITLIVAVAYRLSQRSIGQFEPDDVGWTLGGLCSRPYSYPPLSTSMASRCSGLEPQYYFWMRGCGSRHGRTGGKPTLSARSSTGGCSEFRCGC